MYFGLDPAHLETIVPAGLMISDGDTKTASGESSSSQAPILLGHRPYSVVQQSHLTAPSHCDSHCSRRPRGGSEARELDSA